MENLELRLTLHPCLGKPSIGPKPGSDPFWIQTDKRGPDCWHVMLPVNSDVDVCYMPREGVGRTVEIRRNMIVAEHELPIESPEQVARGIAE
jgi:hypothetical protein